MVSQPQLFKAMNDIMLLEDLLDNVDHVRSTSQVSTDTCLSPETNIPAVGFGPSAVCWQTVPYWISISCISFWRQIGAWGQHRLQINSCNTAIWMFHSNHSSRSVTSAWCDCRLWWLGSKAALALQVAPIKLMFSSWWKSSSTWDYCIICTWICLCFDFYIHILCICIKCTYLYIYIYI